MEDGSRVRQANPVKASIYASFGTPAEVDRLFQLSRRYFPTARHMKAVDDLFSAPGTRLFSAPRASTNAGTEWRNQLRLVAQPGQRYLEDHDAAIREIDRLAARAERLRGASRARDSRLVTTGYGLWRTQARAHRLFVEAAAAHAGWMAGTPGSERELAGIAHAMECLAGKSAARFGRQFLFRLVPRLEGMAAALESPPRGGEGHVRGRQSK